MKPHRKPKKSTCPRKPNRANAVSSIVPGEGVATLQLGQEVEIVGQTAYADIIPGQHGFFKGYMEKGYAIEITAAFSKADRTEVRETQTRVLYFNAANVHPIPSP